MIGISIFEGVWRNRVLNFYSYSGDIKVFSNRGKRDHQDVSHNTGLKNSNKTLNLLQDELARMIE